MHKITEIHFLYRDPFSLSLTNCFCEIKRRVCQHRYTVLLPFTSYFLFRTGKQHCFCERILVYSTESARWDTISKLQTCQISMQPGQMILSQFAILLCMEFVRFYIYVPTVYKRPLFPLSLHKSIMALEKTWSSQSMLCIAIIIVASLWIGCEILLASNFCVLWICGFSK